MSRKTTAIGNRLNKSVGWQKHYFPKNKEGARKSIQNFTQAFLVLRYYFGCKKMRLFYFNVFFCVLDKFPKTFYMLLNKKVHINFLGDVKPLTVKQKIYASLYTLTPRPHFEYEEILSDAVWDDSYKQIAHAIFKRLAPENRSRFHKEARLPQHRKPGHWFQNNITFFTKWNNFVVSAENYLGVLSMFAENVNTKRLKFHPFFKGIQKNIQKKNYPAWTFLNIINYTLLLYLVIEKIKIKKIFKKYKLNSPLVFLKWPAISVVKKFFERFNYVSFQPLIARYKKHRYFKNTTRIFYLFEEFKDPLLVTEHIAYELTKKKKHSPIINGIRNMLNSKEFFEQFIFKVIKICIAGKINGKSRTRHAYIHYGLPPRLSAFNLPIMSGFSDAGARTGNFGIKAVVQLD